MKKILSLLIGILMLSSVIAGPPVPMPFVIYLTFEGSPVKNIDITLNCDGEEIVRTTNDKGGIMVDLGDGSPDFSSACSLISITCAYAACNHQYLVDDIDSPFIIAYELQEAPPQPECLVDSDCPSDFECTNQKCVEIYVPPEEPEPESKVTSNADKTTAFIESFYGETIDVVVNDNDLAILFDGEIRFDTEDYDVHEEIRIKGKLATSLDDTDYRLKPYLVLAEGAIEYRYVFDDTLPKATIENDEELEINFLGEAIEIIHMTDSKVIIRHGELFTDGCVEGESFDYESLPVSILTINDDFVYLSYNGESSKIIEGNTEIIGGVEFYADEVVPNEEKPGLCSLRIATEVEEEIVDGDEYNSEWEYVVTSNYIGVISTEEYKYLDEEFKPLELKDEIVLPNDFTKLSFSSIDISDSTELRIRLRDSYLNVEGDRDDSFSFENNDYDELFVSAEGIFDEDKVLISDKVRIGESDFYLDKVINIGDLRILLGFEDISYKGVSFGSDDDNYLTYLGLIFKDAEDSVQNKGTFEVIVPDERPEVTLTLGETVIVDPVDCPVCEIFPETNATCVGPDCPVCTEEECKNTVCPPEKPCPEEKPCDPCTTCPVCPEGNETITAVIALILGLAGGAGLFFSLFNKKIFTSSNTGLKTYRGRDGTLKMHHKHPGTRGYHDPENSHRDPEKHPKGMVDVSNHYSKNEAGDWEYY